MKIENSNRRNYENLNGPPKETRDAKLEGDGGGKNSQSQLDTGARMSESRASYLQEANRSSSLENANKDLEAVPGAKTEQQDPINKGEISQPPESANPEKNE